MTRWKRGLWAALLLLLGACRGAVPEQDADPALWVLRDADTTIYLFGTIHTLKPGVRWFDDAVRDAYDSSDQLVLELVMPDAASMAALTQELGTRRDGPPLSARLTPARREKLAAALRQQGAAADALDRADPWLAVTTLAGIDAERKGFSRDNGAEEVLARAGKPVTGLETARDQLSWLDGLSMPTQMALLDQTIDGLDTPDDTLAQVVDAWAHGDVERLGMLMNADLKATPELAQTMLYARNRRWAGWIARRMVRPGTVFVAVGAGHLAGPGSVQDELARRGLRVERVRY
ncbi:MAG: TraB/GumN family protein [Pseudomonadota bacterium]